MASSLQEIKFLNNCVKRIGPLFYGDEAIKMADWMIVMNGVIAEQIGTPLEVCETPRALLRHSLSVAR
ncbi:MAG: hypothetical protein ABJ263_03990 [Tateyamaria sp.]|uniref:hypothetical protein n=1 Tax=Tateyamaria sp. TaxID=1929288 RepID=UPI00327E40A7